MTQHDEEWRSSHSPFASLTSDITSPVCESFPKESPICLSLRHEARAEPAQDIGSILIGCVLPSHENGVPTPGIGVQRGNRLADPCANWVQVHISDDLFDIVLVLRRALPQRPPPGRFAEVQMLSRRRRRDQRAVGIRDLTGTKMVRHRSPQVYAKKRISHRPGFCLVTTMVTVRDVPSFKAMRSCHVPVENIPLFRAKE